MKTKWTLIALFFLLFAADGLLAFVSKTDGFEIRFDSGSLAITAVMIFWLINGVRGSRTSFNLLATWLALLGVLGLTIAFTDRNGAFQMAASGLLEIAQAIVILLLKDEVQRQRLTKEPLAAHWKEPIHRPDRALIP